MTITPGLNRTVFATIKKAPVNHGNRVNVGLNLQESDINAIDPSIGPMGDVERSGGPAAGRVEGVLEAGGNSVTNSA